jgi:hypothetical protein
VGRRIGQSVVGGSDEKEGAVDIDGLGGVHSKCLGVFCGRSCLRSGGSLEGDKMDRCESDEI